MIKEVIIVEGKDDIARVKSALDCDVLATGGFAFGRKFLSEARAVEKRRGVIIFTDPDYEGNRIRRRLERALDHPKHAFLDQQIATTKKGNIGVENAPPEAIVAAILSAKPQRAKVTQTFNSADMIRYGLSGKEGSEELRREVALRLGIGHGNSKQFLNKLNRFAVRREELEQVLEEVHGI